MDLHHLDAHEIVKINCELYKSDDTYIDGSWKEADKLLPFNGFTRESVTNIELRRIFSMITLNYISLKIQSMLKINLLDRRRLYNGVFITRESNNNQRRFNMIINFTICDDKTRKPLKKYVTATLHVHENPSPWIVACRFDEWN